MAFTSAIQVFGQKPAEKKDEKAAPKPNNPKGSATAFTAEQVVESTIVVYAYPAGRAMLNQIRRTAFERGKVTVTAADGQTTNASYQRWVLRGDVAGKEKVRLEQDFPTARYSLVHSDDKVFGIYNDSVFQPREDATKAFENQIFHSIDALLRYKENESKIELGGKEKMFGVEYHLIDMTDKQGRKTRFYVSVRSFRVMMLDYESDGVKHTRKFYNYKYAQGTLVPFRTVLLAAGKIIEETDVGTVTFGQKVDEGLFTAS